MPLRDGYTGRPIHVGAHKGEDVHVHAVPAADHRDRVADRRIAHLAP
jgi:hypothetical protein